MAKRSILVSDISGEEVTEENGVQLRATFPGEEQTATMDITKAEWEAFSTDKKTGEFVGRMQGKRGRKPGSTNDNGEVDKS